MCILKNFPDDFYFTSFLKRSWVEGLLTECGSKSVVRDKKVEDSEEKVHRAF